MHTRQKFTLSPALALLVLFGGQPPGHTQTKVESLGLANQGVTSLGFYGGVFAVGTGGNGVFWQAETPYSEAGWLPLPLPPRRVETVFAHKSGPIGWAISAGMAGNPAVDPVVYCSYLGQDFVPESHGIRDSLTSRITSLDGFPDPTICGETFAAGGRAVYRRYFADTTWVPVYIGAVPRQILAVRVHDLYPGVVMAGGSEQNSGVVLISPDFGASWLERSSGLPPVHQLDFTGDSARTILIAAGGVLKSTDQGASWRTVLSPPSQSVLTLIAVDSWSPLAFSAGFRSAGDTATVLFRSADLGEHWDEIQLDLPGPPAGMAYGWDNWVYLAIPRAGVVRVQPEVTGVERVPDLGPDETHLLNFPNPFNTATVIRFTLPVPARVRLRIFDAGGRLVQELLSAELAAGERSVRWDAAEVGSGTYIVQLEMGKKIARHKILVLK